MNTLRVRHVAESAAGVIGIIVVWWLVTDAIAASCYGFPTIVPPTVRAKYATGNGNAGKDEVLAAVIRRWPHAPVENNDQADAFVIAAIAAHLDGHPLSDMPDSHVAALKTLGGPDVAR